MMHILRPLAFTGLDNKGSSDQERLKITNIVGREKYQKYWENHLQQMEGDHLL
jgi:hypothetical protein